MDHKTSESCWEQLWNTFTAWEIPIHGLLVSQKDTLLWESYQPPYQADTLHRMFSITKSYCSLAVGSLAAEGKLSLDDPIIRFFPEYLPPDKEIHPYLRDMTIRHMLRMETCHSSTTYKLHSDQNWVESFFITPPSHKSGQIFLYDTSSSHTMAALVKKLTGQGVLDYLRGQFLDSIGFSKEAYIISDPFGSEMGGSGLMARPRDLMATARYIMDQIKHGTDSFADYLREAVSFQTPTLHSGQTLDEQQGYGYQFWRIRDGFAMYGMGGQYVLFYPQWDLIAAVTADSQNIKGGTQKILDALRSAVLTACLGKNASGIPCADTFYGRNPGSDDCSTDSPGSDPLHAGSSCSDQLHTGSAPRDNLLTPVFFHLLPSKSGFTDLSLRADSQEGFLTLTGPKGISQIPFGFHGLKTGILSPYGEPIASRGQWLGRDSLLIRTQITGESVGSLTFMLRLRPDGLTLWMKKVEETFFGEFDGFAEGVRVTKA